MRLPSTRRSYCCLWRTTPTYWGDPLLPSTNIICFGPFERGRYFYTHHRELHARSLIAVELALLLEGSGVAIHVHVLFVPAKVTATPSLSPHITQLETFQTGIDQRPKRNEKRTVMRAGGRGTRERGKQKGGAVAAAVVSQRVIRGCSSSLSIKASILTQSRSASLWTRWRTAGETATCKDSKQIYNGLTVQKEEKQARFEGPDPPLPRSTTRH